MKKQKIFLTGGTGTMGFATLERLLEERKHQNVILLALDTPEDRKKLAPYEHTEGVEIVWGNLLDYEKVLYCVKGSDIVLHIGAMVSPKADYNPELTMKVNFGSTRNIIKAIYEAGQENHTRFVYIGTVAETGERLPPLHWGRVGDPIKPSMFDYYAVSKVAAERYVIESGLKYWVSLRQTGIIGEAMCQIQDAILLHNGFDVVLEYCSDRDSARAMKHLCDYTYDGSLDEAFWGHIYNIGGGESCRMDTYTMYKTMFEKLGIRDIGRLFSPKKQAALNFHGQYYLDSDKLENYLHFRQDSMDYLFDCYLKVMNPLPAFTKIICKLPLGEKMIADSIRKNFDKMGRTENGTLRFLEENMEDRIDAYWGSRERWEALPDNLNELDLYTEWDKVVVLNHGYDESKPESELDYNDMKRAAEYRGGKLISETMETGNWKDPLEFECAFGHRFYASPRLVLEGGHWCSECERKSWNYGVRAQKDPFFAQVWTPLHRPDEVREYVKIISELDVE